MKEQPLFGRAPAQRHSATSIAAAEGIDDARMSLRSRVYKAIVRSGPDGMTDEEIQLLLEMNPSTQRPRRVELARAGLIRPSGSTRRTTSGRKAVVWVAA